MKDIFVGNLDYETRVTWKERTIAPSMISVLLRRCEITDLSHNVRIPPTITTKRNTVIGPEEVGACNQQITACVLKPVGSLGNLVRWLFANNRVLSVIA
jgi:hypothetical protein